MSAVVVDDDRLLLVRRGRGRAQGRWALPGGRVEHGELLVEAVLRELAEETGVDAVCGPLLGVVELLADTGEGPVGPMPHQVVLVHRADVIDPVEPVAGDDAAEARWVPLADVVDLALVDGLAEFLHDHQVIATIT